MKQLPLWALLVPLVVILVLGWSTIWSTTPSLALSQFIYILVGLLGVLILSRIDPRVYQSLSWPIYFGVIFLLVITDIIGFTSRGSIRWIPLGPVHLQTSELAKIGLILVFGSWFHGAQEKGFKWLITQMILAAIPIFLVFRQPDLGSALVLGVIWLGMILFSGVNWKYLLLLGLMIGVVVPVGFKLMKPYQRDRLESFISPYSDPSGSGYNVIQAMIAVGSGRIVGKGVRQGSQSQLRFLPERQTDFAFASFAEEFGFVGVSLLLVSFGVLLWWLAKLSNRLKGYERLVVQGVFFWIFFQFFVNAGMNMGMMPVTGITLPFVSYGGSSVISLLFGLGIVLAIFLHQAQRFEI